MGVLACMRGQDVWQGSLPADSEEAACPAGLDWATTHSQQRAQCISEYTQPSDTHACTLLARCCSPVSRACSLLGRTQTKQCQAAKPAEILAVSALTQAVGMHTADIWWPGLQG